MAVVNVVVVVVVVVGGDGRCSGDFRFLKYVNSISKNAHNTTFTITTYHH